MDGTLFYGNSTFDFIAFVLKDDPAYLRFKRHYRFLKVYNKILFKVFGYDWYKRKSVNFLAGKTKNELCAKSREFYSEHLSEKSITEVFDILGCYRENGYEIGIISATLDLIAEEVARQLRADVVFATPLVYSCDVATGKYEYDLLHQKLGVFDRWISEHYDRVVFLSDNREDKPLLKRVTIGARLYVNS